MNKMKLGEVCQINPKDKPEDMTLQVSFIPMQSVSETGEIDTSDIRSISDVCKGFTSFSEGDVLMAKITPCMENGKGAIAKGLHNGKGYGSTEFFVLRPDLARVSSEWIYYFTAGRQFRRDCEKNMTGSAGQKRVPKTYLEKKEIPVPSLEKQRILVDNLKRTKKIISLRKQQLTELDTLVKARFVEMFGEPFSSAKWNVRALSDVSVSLVDGSNIDPKFYQTSGEVLFLRIQNVWRNEFRLDDSVYVSQAVNESYIDTSLRNGDLLITKIGRFYTKDSSLGRVSVYRGEDNRANYSNNIIRVRLNGTVNSEFVNTLLNLDDYQTFIRNTSKGGTDKRALSKSLIGSYPIIVPPIELQNQFAAFVEQTDKSKSVVQKALDEAQTLFDSLMQQYFG